MATDSYSVLCSGKLLTGYNEEAVIDNLSTISKMEREKAKKLLLITRPTVLKKGLDQKQAESLASLLSKAGLEVSLRKETVVESLKEDKFPKDEEKDVPQKPIPKTSEIEDDPYSAPRSDLEVQREKQSQLSSIPRKVNAMRGLSWISLAAKLFFQQPLQWLGIGFVAILISFLFMLIPIIGSLIYNVVFMVFAGSLMIAGQQQIDGEQLEVKVVFSGFGESRNQLILVGVIYLVGMVAISLIAGLFFFLAFGASFFPLIIGDGDPAGMSEMAPNFLFIGLAVLLGLALSIPLMMGMWFAAPLVALANQKAVDAFKTSFQACLKNVVPFLVYGIAFMVIGMGIFAVFTAAMGVSGVFAGDGGTILFFFVPFIMMVLFGLPFTLIGGLSVFTGFIDIFSPYEGD